ncbi:flagellar protein FlaG [Paenibacillus sp. 1P07SE]|uniref:flagellar protein FlaG n=1 Tax=Paenibacillus sp. 1P07SE TaxID=3132209 RepID=UPI0039A76D62
MSSHMSVPGSGNSIITDGSAELIGKSKSQPSITDHTIATIPSSINNMSDLKRAELRGERYTVSDEQIVKGIERAIKAMQGKATNLEFSIHEKTKAINVKVKDAETGDTIREIPPEKILDFVANLWEMAGLFVDEKR